MGCLVIITAFIKASSRVGDRLVSTSDRQKQGQWDPETCPAAAVWQGLSAGTLKARLAPRVVHLSSFGPRWAFALPREGRKIQHRPGTAPCPRVLLLLSPIKALLHRLEVSGPSRLGFSPGETTCWCHIALISFGFSHTSLCVGFCQEIRKELKLHSS